MNFIGIVVTTVIVMGLGGGGFYLLWLFTRPKKMTWKVDVYQLGEGIQPPQRDKTGTIISEVRLADLRPYTSDTLERVEKSKGIVVYWLTKLKKATPPVNANVVEFWGDKDKRIKALIDGETVTLLKSGYDKKTGTQIFKPLPADRINFIKTEISERKERIKEKKDILTAITPWVMGGIIVIGFVMVAYIVADGLIQTSENIKEASRINSEAISTAANLLIESGCGDGSKIFKDIQKEQPPEVKG